MNSAKVLLIDDDIDVFNIVQRAINPLVTLDYAEDLESAVTLIKQNNYLLILVDLNIGSDNGLDFIKYYSDTNLFALNQIIMLTGKGHIQDEVEGHELGIREYLKKPLNINVLRAILDKHLESILKSPTKILKDGPFTLDLIMHTTTIQKDGAPQEINLTSKEFLILKLFIENQEQIFHRDTIYQKIWSEESESLSRTVDMHISSLRKKIAPYSDFLQNKRARGYFFKIEK